MSFTKDYIAKLAIWRDDMTDALVLLRSLGPRGPEDDGILTSGGQAPG